MFRNYQELACAVIEQAVKEYWQRCKKFKTENGLTISNIWFDCVDVEQDWFITRVRAKGRKIIKG